jgi:hypothetical protein
VKAVNEESRSTSSQQQGSQLQIAPQSAFNNPYLDIVGDGPYGKDQAFYGKYQESVDEPELDFRGKKGNRRDFTPYFDSADARNSADFGSLEKDSFRVALGAKNANSEMRREATNAIQTATTRRDELNVEKPLSLVPGSEPMPSPGLFGRYHPPTTPTTFRSKFEVPISPKIAKVGAVDSSNPTDHQWLKYLSPVVEAPSPLKVSSKNQPTTRPKHKYTPTLDHVLKLRADEQAKALAMLEGDSLEKKQPGEDHRHAPRALSWKISDSKSHPVHRITSHDQKRHASEFIAEPGSPEPKKLAATCLMADPVDPTEKDDRSSSSVYSNDDNVQEDEIDRFSKAVAGLHPFQDLPSPLPNKTGFQRRSAVPAGLDWSKVEAGQEELENGAGAQQMQQAPRQRTLKGPHARILKYPNVQKTDTGRGGVETTGCQDDSSAESFAIASEEDYERVGVEEELIAEQNGVKRRWYKGFCKV